MKQKLPWTGIGAFTGMLILILDGKTALEGARAGMELCLVTVIPSLFPFFLLSILLTDSFLGASPEFLRPLGRLFRIPPGAEALLIPGFLGGYPSGAQAIAQAFRSGSLSKQDAERMLGFGNNAGPAFLFGMIGSIFSRRGAVWLLWGIHVFSALLSAAVLPGQAGKPVQLAVRKQLTLSDGLAMSIRTMAAVCGWVVLFRVVIAFLTRWILWLFPLEAQVAVTGFLELSNGCWELRGISGEALRFILCSGMLAWGGLCVAMQTRSVTQGLSLRYYVAGKLLQTVFSLCLAAALWNYQMLVLLSGVVVLTLILRKAQNRSSLSPQTGV